MDQEITRSFGRNLRLKSSEDFQKVRKQGRKHSTKSFLIYILPNTNNTTRLGLIVGRHAGCAARRNRLKRLLREFFRLNNEAFPLSADIVISVKKENTSVKDYKDVETELLAALKMSRRDHASGGKS
ncbi:MAG TPA: ribonuclease P protein component [Thermodesulfobacteriota bacterium]|nr:ribonuclease P protein component [Thermodesulfobacteriota bacterium]